MMGPIVLDAAPTVPGIGQRLRRHIWSALLVAGVSFAILAAVVLNLRPLYRSEATLLLEERQARVLSSEQVLPQMASDTEAVLTEVRVLYSRALAQETVDALDLVHQPDFNPVLEAPTLVGNAKQWIRSLIGAADPNDEASGPEAVRARAVDILLKSLRVQPVDRSRAISLAISGHDAALTAAIVNTHARRYLEDQVERKIAATRRAQSFLESQVAELRGRVQLAEAKVEDFRNANGLLRVGNGSSLAAQQLAEVSDQLMAARSKLADARARVEQAEDPRRSIALPEVVNNLLVTRLREQEAQLRRDLIQSAATLGRQHPQVLQLQAAIADLQTRIGEEIGKVGEALRSEFAVLERNVGALDGRLNMLREQTERANSSDVEARALAREAEAERNLLHALLARRQEVSASLALLQPDARVISNADRPLMPVFPRTLLFLAVSMFASIAVGCAAALLPHRRSAGFKSMDDIAPQLGTRALGLVPAVRGAARSADYVLRRPESAYAESIRSIFTNLMLSEARPVSIAVTSALPDEGKSSVSLALAQMAARSGLRTLLVDADLRRPSLHQTLGLRAGPGLHELLSGVAQPNEVVQWHNASKFSVIAAGNSGHDVAALLVSGTMQQQVARWEKEFDLVIIDTSPLAPVADARLTARTCSAVVFVALWDRTRRNLVQAELNRLRELGACVAGVVLTQVNVSSHARDGYSDSGYFAAYGRAYVRD